MDRREIKEFLDTKIGNGVAQGLQFNQYGTHPRQEGMTEAGIEVFNEVYQFLHTLKLATIKRTKSGAIAKGMSNWGNCAAWDVTSTPLGIRLTVIFGGRTYVLKVGSYRKDNDPGIYPNKAFNKFKDACEEQGIDLMGYAEDDGIKYKESIPRPMVKMMKHMDVKDKGISHVSHIDFHSSYPAGLCNTHPEFRKVVEPIYLNRKKDPSCKAILNFTIGCMQSPKEPFKARWSRLAKDAIEDNNNRIIDMMIKLTMAGREIIGLNTDGIWYKGDVYHGEGEGDGLGQWRNDHVDCLFRSRSDGAYEFIENGKYNVVVRGLTGYDKINPDRNTWQWGDIYKADVIYFEFIEGKGLRLIKE